MINTGTTIVTFLVVFMIQNTQNRDSRAIHLKLDELIRAIQSARNRLVDIEDMSDEELARLAREFERLRDEPDATDQPDPDQPGASDRQADQTERLPARGGARAHPGAKHRATPPASRAGSLRTVAHRTRNRPK